MPEEGGPFSFDLTRRNAYLEKRGVKGPGFTKTGTTIAGVIFKVNQGCMLAVHCFSRCGGLAGTVSLAHLPLPCQQVQLSVILLIAAQPCAQLSAMRYC